MRYRIRHETLYRYSADVVHSHQLLHLVPRPAPFQQCLEYALEIRPVPLERRDEIDVFGNPMTSIELEHAHRELRVLAEMEVQVHPRPMLLAADSWPWEEVREALAYRVGTPPGREHLQAGAFRHESAFVRIKQVFAQYAADCFAPGRPILAAADALSSKLHHDFRYAPGETAISTPLLQVFEQRVGVCQDFAHVMLACLRSLGLAARYVSGYVRRVPQAAREVGQHDAPSASAGAEGAAGAAGAEGASHAWIAVYCPPFGWVELDPTNDARVATDHVAVAWGRDFADVSPLRGVILGGGTHALSVSVTVEAIQAQSYALT
ncbi:MAG TPA: transglutaminase family protein [Steroidobacteraceae bacterium]|nr:transglutaminase family protein [Steroidobacteraceae bacterium]